MKKNNYMNRAMRSNDPRFARILGRLGYETRDMKQEVDPLTELRAKYTETFGKKPFHGWDAETLAAKIEAEENKANPE